MAASVGRTRAAVAGVDREDGRALESPTNSRPSGPNVRAPAEPMSGVPVFRSAIAVAGEQYQAGDHCRPSLLGSFSC